MDILLTKFESEHTLSQPEHIIIKHLGIDQNNWKEHKNKLNKYIITYRFKNKYTTYKYYLR